MVPQRPGKLLHRFTCLIFISLGEKLVTYELDNMTGKLEFDYNVLEVQVVFRGFSEMLEVS